MTPTPAPAELVEKWTNRARGLRASEYGQGKQHGIKECRDELAASLAAHGRVEVDDAMVGRACDAYESTPGALYYKNRHSAMKNALIAALEKTP